MHIESRARGPDLVLVHGWAMHGGVFEPLTERLAPHFRLHLVDLPGHGYSRDENAGPDLRACAQRIVDTTPPALWLGWSLGGLIALRAAIDFPDHVRGLVLIAVNPRFVTAPQWAHGVAHEVFESFSADLRSDYRRAIDRFLALELHGSAQAREQLRDLKRRVFERGDPSIEVLQQGLDILDGADFRDDLPKLTMPSLWIAGSRDKLVPAAAMRWAATHSPRGSYLELPSGHAPFLGHAEAIAEAIETFAATALPP
ncbi:MAG: pimeloyl-ACP methyl ester esterase BioH [Rhodanobacteraceae bacterium]